MVKSQRERNPGKPAQHRPPRDVELAVAYVRCGRPGASPEKEQPGSAGRSSTWPWNPSSSAGRTTPAGASWHLGFRRIQRPQGHGDGRRNCGRGGEALLLLRSPGQLIGQMGRCRTTRDPLSSSPLEKALERPELHRSCSGDPRQAWLLALLTATGRCRGSRSASTCRLAGRNFVSGEANVSSSTTTPPGRCRVERDKLFGLLPHRPPGHNR